MVVMLRIIVTRGYVLGKLIITSKHYCGEWKLSRKSTWGLEAKPF